jgi:hypothetical protein
VQEQLGENRHLKGKHKAHHPFEYRRIGLERCHVVVALAESGGGLSALSSGMPISRNASKTKFALQSIAVSAPRALPVHMESFDRNGIAQYQCVGAGLSRKSPSSFSSPALAGIGAIGNLSL